MSVNMSVFTVDFGNLYPLSQVVSLLNKSELSKLIEMERQFNEQSIPTYGSTAEGNRIGVGVAFFPLWGPEAPTDLLGDRAHIDTAADCLPLVLRVVAAHFEILTVDLTVDRNWSSTPEAR